MSTTTAYHNYLKHEVDGASQGRIIVMLYDACMKFVRLAMTHIDEKNVPEAHNNIIRAENIIYELMSTLNMDDGKDVAENLLRLYDFIVWQLVEANTFKDKTRLESVLKVISPLRDAWKELVARESASQAKAEGAEVASINFAG